MGPWMKRWYHPSFTMNIQRGLKAWWSWWLQCAMVAWWLHRGLHLWNMVIEVSHQN
jgi:hypothetical protein